MNQIQTLRLYRHQGTWAFDDPRFNLTAEPFVLGAEHMIDRLAEAAGKGDAEEVTVAFSTDPFPEATRFLWLEDQFGGAWYCDEHGSTGWLCPAGLNYFAVWPEMFWARVLEVV